MSRKRTNSVCLRETNYKKESRMGEEATPTLHMVSSGLFLHPLCLLPYPLPHWRLHTILPLWLQFGLLRVKASYTIFTTTPHPRFPLVSNKKLLLQTAQCAGHHWDPPTGPHPLSPTQTSASVFFFRETPYHSHSEFSPLPCT